MIAALAHRYRIERKLGQGGMATVYSPRIFASTGLKPVFDVAPDGRFLMLRWRPKRRPLTEPVMLERWTDLLPR